MLQAQKMESVGQLAGGIAHDFNNMLTAINGNCSLLLRELPRDHPWYEIVDDILGAGKRAAELTRQLLAFSRKQILQPTSVNLNQIVTKMQSMLQRLIGENIRLAVELQQDLGPVHADPGQIEQALLNLSVNARDAMPNGGTLTFRTFQTDSRDVDSQESSENQAEVYRCLAVSDTGQGMDKDTQKRIFEPFFTTKKAGKGTGMGLATVYGIVKQSGGQVTVDSELDRGTTFTLCLPAVATEVTTVSPPEQDDSLSTGKETILLVEDEANVRSFVRRILEMCGYTVLEAKDSTRAVELSDGFDQEIHLLISDIIMPQMSGPNLAKLIAKSRPKIKTILISGYAGADLKRTPLGPDDHYLQKPFSPKRLSDKVREVLDS